LRIHSDAIGIDLRDSAKGVFNVVFNGCRLDDFSSGLDRIEHADHSSQVSHSGLGCLSLILPLRGSLEDDPALLNDGLDVFPGYREFESFHPKADFSVQQYFSDGVSGAAQAVSARLSAMSQQTRPRRAVVTPGVALKSLRTSRGWTLADVARKTGIPVATLSKVENGKSELTMDRMLRISVALEVNIADLFGSPAREPAKHDRARRSITRLGEGNLVASSYGDYCYHAQDLLDKRAAPLIATIRARSLEEFGEYHRHEGEEFLFVLDGMLSLHTDTYAPVTLEKGESIYFDSGMGHAYLCASEEACRILLICVAEGRGVLHMVEGSVTSPEESVVRLFAPRK
jgi:transcriptional regulator with XRE-family HTH domain